MGGTLRRRRAGEEGDLQESLLGNQGPTSSSAPSSESRHLIVHTPFHLEEFIALILQRWQAFLETLQECINSLLGRSNQQSISLIQAERLEELQSSLAVPYDGANAEHQECLRELWGLAFPGVPCTSLKSKQWTEMGWQGPDPGTDFRGAGLYGLQNLLYLGNSHPEVFRRLLHKTTGKRAAWEYPFAVAGLNVTHMLTELLGLQAAGGQEQVLKTAAGRAFMEQLHDSETAFEELYITAFELLDSTWLDMGASYMEFNAVLKATRAKLEKALTQGKAPSIAAVRQRLGLGPLHSSATWAQAS